MSAVLRVVSAYKQYYSRVAFSDISFSLESGEALCLLGLNGAGKTSLIKSVLNLQYIDRGDIQLCGYAAQDTRARAEVAYLPERLSPPGFMRGLEYLQFMLEGHGQRVSGSMLRRLAEQLLQRLSLDPKILEQSVKAYSKGMLQKLGILATVLSGRQLLILDEPMSGLDPQARAQVRQLLAEQKLQGKSVLLSTHILSDVAWLSDRVVILHSGRLVFAGTADECCVRFGGTDFESAFFACIQQADSLRV